MPLQPLREPICRETLPPQSPRHVRRPTKPGAARSHTPTPTARRPRALPARPTAACPLQSYVKPSFSEHQNRHLTPFNPDIFSNRRESSTFAAAKRKPCRRRGSPRARPRNGRLQAPHKDNANKHTKQKKAHPDTRHTAARSAPQAQREPVSTAMRAATGPHTGLNIHHRL